jgi:hypothetical protein
MNEKPAIVDGRRIINPHEAEDLGFVYYGVGFPVRAMQKPAKKTVKPSKR